MNAYYYSFGETGEVEIDRILSAVACAGKGCHHTEDWAEFGYPESIMRWAVEAAAALRRARRDTALADAARRWVKAQTLFRTASQDDRDYAAKSAELIRAEHAFYDAVATVLPGRDADHG